MSLPHPDRSQLSLQFVAFFKPCFPSTLYAEAGSPPRYIRVASPLAVRIYSTRHFVPPRRYAFLCPVPDVPVQSAVATYTNVQVGANAAFRCPRRFKNEHLLTA